MIRRVLLAIGLLGAAAACATQPPKATTATAPAPAANVITAPKDLPKEFNEMVAHPSEVALVPAYPETPLLGPAQAKGAVIFNHGYDYDEDSSGEPPFFLDRVRDAGWDVFTLLRPFLEDRDDRGPAILEEKARGLRQQGYRRIVSVGQSYGAWISIQVAADPGVLDAIVATAPARYGEVPPASFYNVEIVDIARRMAPTPTLIFLFQQDDFDPTGDRGDGFRKVLAKKGAGYAVVDRPEGFLGHAVAMSTAFSAAFAPCIIDFIAAPPPPGPFACEPRKLGAAEITARFRKADRDTAIARTVSSPFLGRWYGWYPGGGREALLSVDHVTADGRADGTYAFGAAHHDERGGAYAVSGEVANGVLHVSTPHSELYGHLRPDGCLELHWSTAGGNGEAVFRKLEEDDP